MTNAIGSLVVSNRFFTSLPMDLQQLLKSTGQETGRKINTIARRDNQKSIELLKQSGIEFMWDWNSSEQDELLAIRDRAAAKLAESDYIPASYFQRSKQLLNQFRSGQ
jgi:TRAP-type C4-dicarboxylate transport system substrate-binding protein